MSLLSRKEFLSKMAAAALLPLQGYEKPEVTVWKLSQLDAYDSYSKSFDSMDDYNHSANHLPSGASQLDHIFRGDHGIGDMSEWASKIESMTQDGSNYLGEVLKGTSGTVDQRMLLGYQTIMDDGRQMWAYVGKITHGVEDAGINSTPWIWVEGEGFVRPQGADMDVCDLVYVEMFSSIGSGAKALGMRYMDNGDWSTVGRYLVYAERFEVWENGGSFDPAIFEVFKKTFFETFGSTIPDARQSYDFVRDYLKRQERIFNFSYKEGSSDLLDAFDAGAPWDFWQSAYEGFTEGLVVLDKSIS